MKCPHRVKTNTKYCKYLFDQIFCIKPTEFLCVELQELEEKLAKIREKKKSRKRTNNA